MKGTPPRFGEGPGERFTEAEGHSDDEIAWIVHRTPVVSETKEESVRPLSNHSFVVANLQPNSQVLLYARGEDADEARQRIATVPRRRK